TLTTKPARSAAQTCAPDRNQKTPSPNRATLRAAQVTLARYAADRKNHQHSTITARDA
ncbi:hypothetical protein A2U01_0079734, partial [Trifolium medium]|nr:hypothetical protein [Trifolium medium]